METNRGWEHSLKKQFELRNIAAGSRFLTNTGLFLPVRGLASRFVACGSLRNKLVLQHEELAKDPINLMKKVPISWR